MPEEVVIILAIICGIIWLVVKILQGVGEFIDQVSKSYEAASARRRHDRYTNALIPIL